MCDQPNCPQHGPYRAPKSRDRLNDYHWFCLEHVRAYNKAWNYCLGMSEDEIEHEIRASTVWDRPTWPAGVAPHMEDRLRQAASRFGYKHHEEEAAPRPQKHTPETKALATLGLAASATFKMIKEKYRELVKQHHPDRNGGDVHAEERFKTISQAFHTLKRAHELDKVS